ncbi:ribonuclease T2 family protein [Komagataeibacter oboediens]|uniref:ribonuclease T2 family protein n=1 Tax=Komagataeibacter oboediens TaxID=65958 RepID=UPI001C2D57EB|nr:ribonuclease I [Komagataeibacter oboediens]MBV1824030.1 ribonuclease I [Komagataeibacter oboediens]
MPYRALTALRGLHPTLAALVPALCLMAGCAHTPPSTHTDALSIPVTRHGDFGHYTLALTWQPGFCTDQHGPSCQPDQPHAPLIGLHGLWASRPSDLVREGLPVTQWWIKGCDIYQHDDTPPQLSPALSKRLSGTVAHTRSSLVTHEYTKHVQCFGMNAERFFTVASTLRDRFAAGPVGRELDHDAGRDISKADVIGSFERTYGTLPERGLQFRCNTDAQGQPILAQLWFTLDPRGLGRFPAASGFLPSPDVQDNCPARFRVPTWPVTAQAG